MGRQGVNYHGFKGPDFLARMALLESELEKARQKKVPLGEGEGGAVSNLTVPAGLLQGLFAVMNRSALLLVDEGGNRLFTWIHDEMRRSLGIKADEQLDTTTLDVALWGGFPERSEVFRKVLRENRPERIIVPVAIGGQEHWHDVRMAPVRAEEGQRQDAVFVLIVDVTERVEAERAAVETASLYRTLIEQVADPVIIHDVAGGSVVFANKAALGVFGVGKSSDLEGKTPLDFIHRDHVDSFRSRIGSLERGEQQQCLLEALLIDANGAEKWIEASSVPVIYQGRPSALWVFRDTTERKKDEQLRRALDERLLKHQKQQSLAILAAGLAHDFNNLMMGVMGHASLLARDLEWDESSVKRLKRIEEAAASAAELTKKLQTYAGTDRPRLRPARVPEILAETVELIRPSVSELIQVELDVQDDLPQVFADREMLRQALVSLIVNAAESIGEKAGRIRLEARRWLVDGVKSGKPAIGEISEGEHVVIDVVDTGGGIPRPIRNLIFEPFFSTKFLGRGLGLAAVSGIVRTHGGALIVETEPGRGSRFRLVLPEESKARDSDPPRSFEFVPLGPSSKPVVALVAEDDPNVRAPLAEMLKLSGIEVLEASDGVRALEVAMEASEKPTVAVVDMSMPRMSGAELIDALRKIDPALPIIATSGYARTECERRWPEVKAAVFLQKPYPAEALIEAIKVAIDPKEH